MRTGPHDTARPGDCITRAGLRELIGNRQAADARAGRREDRIGQRGRDGRQARLAHAAERCREIVGRDEMHADFTRRLVHSQHLEPVEVALLRMAVLERDLAVQRDAEPHHHRPLELRAYALRIDLRPAVDRDVDPRHRDLAVGIDLHLAHRRRIRHEAAMRGDPEPVPLRQLASPARLARDRLDHAPQPPGVDRIQRRILAVVHVLHRDVRLETPRGPDQFEQEILRVAAGRVRQLRHETLDSERMRDVVDRAEPADPRVRLRGRVLDPHVRDRERQVRDPLREFARLLVHDAGPEGRLDRRRNRAMLPRDHFPRRIDPAVERFERHGMEIVVREVVLARERQLDGRADRLRQQRRLHHVVGLRLAAETAAEQRHVDRHALARQPERLRDLVARGLRRLRAGPHFASAVRHARDGRGRLHRCVREMRDVVGRTHAFRRAGQRRRRVAVVADHVARLRGSRFERLPIRGRVIVRIGPVLPVDLQLRARLDRRPRVARNDGHAAERLEAGRQRRRRERHDLDDARQLLRRRRVERRHRVPVGRRARDDRVQHAVEPRVDPVVRTAGDDVASVDQRRLALADIAEFGWRFQRHRCRIGCRQRGRFRRQFAEAELASALRVDDLMHGCLDLPRIDAPRRGGSLFEHRARRRARAAQRGEALAQAARAVGVLVAVARLVADGLCDLHARPVRAQFVRHHERDARAHPLPHLGADAGHGDRAIGCDRDEQVRIVSQPVRHSRAAISRICTDGRLARHGRAHERRHAEREQQPAGREAEQQRATAFVMDGEFGRAHAAPPRRTARRIAARMRV